MSPTLLEDDVMATAKATVRSVVRTGYGRHTRRAVRIREREALRAQPCPSNRVAGAGSAPSGLLRIPRVIGRLGKRWALLLASVLATCTQLTAGSSTLWLTILTVTSGLWLLIGAPVVLWSVAARSFISTRDGQVLVAVGCTVLADIVMALTANTVLPLLGVAQPLRQAPLSLCSLLAIVLLAAAVPVPESKAPARGVLLRMKAPPGALAVLGVGTLAVILGIAAPIRLNNGLGGTAAVAALLTCAGLLTLLFVRRKQHVPAVTESGIFFAALSLLLLTSLRGWYITGHDIQREFGVFDLTFQSAKWSIEAFRNPYNACLSINLLPASIARLTGLPGLYVFKVVFPLLFALAPVCLYRAVRNFAPQSVALLSAVYFLAFPTFFTDMAFLARQEIAFLLLACAMVVLTDAPAALLRRRVLFTALLVGIVLSHYSTTYVVLAALGLSYLLQSAWRLSTRKRARSAPQVSSFVTWWMIAVVAVAALVWTGPATHTGGQARSTAKAAVLELLGRKSATGSSDTAYSLFGGTRITTEQRLEDYVADTTRDTKPGRAAGTYLPLKVVKKHPADAVSQPDMPLTSAGLLLEQLGIDVSGFNTFLRQSAARLLQLLLLAGILLTLLSKRPAFRAQPEQIFLSVGALGVIGILTVLPELSVDYGILRAFQQGLFFFAPFIATASIWVFRWAGRRGTSLAFGMSMFLFLDLVGVVPKMVGGYPPQLHLANSGQYYDIYYVHPEERSGIEWLQAHASEAEREDVQSEIQTDRYTFGRMQSLIRGRASNDIYPTLIGVDNYVFLGFTTTHKGEATVFYRGDLVTYRYPIDLLEVTKNKIYSSDGAEVYR